MFIKVTRITTHNEYHEFEVYINILAIITISEYNDGTKIVLNNNFDNNIIIKESVQEIINKINI